MWTPGRAAARIAAIYDIHGNLPALDAVLAEIAHSAPDLILVGGDVATGPMPRETVARLMALGERARFIRGNADRELVARYDGRSRGEEAADEGAVAHLATWAAGQLTRAQRDFLAGFPEQAVVEVVGLGAVLFCHGSPRSDEEIVTPATAEPRMRAILAGIAQAVVVCGHTHMQFDRLVRGTRVVNAGSVGMPYEGQPGAYWALLGPDVSLRRTPYDVARAARLFHTSGFPDTPAFTDENVLNPPPPSAAIAVFEKLAEERAASQ